ncbi:hypothetical protein E7X19_26810, partial [Bacteroides fragilis]
NDTYEDIEFYETLFLLVAIVGLSSCGDKYYSDDYLRNDTYEDIEFYETLFLLVAIVGLSSCGDKYYSD